MFDRGRSGREETTCIARSEELPRGETREYDRYGDRWERRGGEFEYLCRPCYRAENHQSRDDLEGLLTEIGAGDLDREAFLAWYCDRAGRGDRAEE